MDYGCFVWDELRAGDLDQAARFYGDLLGWEFTDHPMGKTILRDGTPIGGVSATKPGVPDHWTSCVATPDVDKAAAAARAGGGVVTTGEPADVPGTGRLAPILDPHKSIFLAVDPEPGTPQAASSPRPFVWHRLRTPDPAAAAAFYSDVFGWTARLSPDGTGGVFQLSDGTRVAEVIATTEARGWLPFVLVDSADAARSHALKLGAKTADPIDIPGIRRYTIITDPLGTEIALHESGGR